MSSISILKSVILFTLRSCKDHFVLQQETNKQNHSVNDFFCPSDVTDKLLIKSHTSCRDKLLFNMEDVW